MNFELFTNFDAYSLVVAEEEDLQGRIIVQTLVFRDGLKYDKENAFGNSEYSLLYSVLLSSEGSKTQLVEMGGIEPPSRKANL